MARHAIHDDFTRFVIRRGNDGSYRIWVKGSRRFLHEDGGGDKLVSTRYQPNDDFVRFLLEPVRR